MVAVSFRGTDFGSILQNGAFEGCNVSLSLNFDNARFGYVEEYAFKAMNAKVVSFRNVEIGTLSTSSFSGSTIGGNFDWSGAVFNCGLPGYAFGDIVVHGAFVLSGATLPYDALSEFVFATSAVGTGFYMEAITIVDCNTSVLDRKLHIPYRTFAGLMVLGNAIEGRRGGPFSLSGTKLDLEPGSLHGLVLRGYNSSIDLSNCEIEELRAGECPEGDDLPWATNDICGPFSGLVYEGVLRTMNLSYNNLSWVSNTSLSVHANITDLRHNENLKFFGPGWASTLLSAKHGEVLTAGNPSECRRSTEHHVDFEAPSPSQQLLIGAMFYGGVVCRCSAGVQGTGFGFCSNNPCQNAPSWIRGNLEILPVRWPIDSGSNITFQCKEGWSLSGVESVMCQGSIFPMPKDTPQCTENTSNDIMNVLVGFLGFLVFLNSWITKNYLLHDSPSPDIRCDKSLVSECFLILVGIVPGGTVYFAKRYKKVRDAQAEEASYAAELQEQLLVSPTPNTHRHF